MNTVAIIAALCTATLVGDVVTWRLAKHHADRAYQNAIIAQEYRNEMADMLVDADGSQQ